MTLTPDQLTADFPEFADADAYPATMLTLWIGVASNLVNACRWGTLATLGLELCTAHYLVLAARDQKAAANNDAPGQVTGVLSSKGVGDVSGSYDVAAVTLADAGFWNQTNYGIRYLSLARLMGAGGLQIW
jgi:hypothetical protein